MNEGSDGWTIAPELADHLSRIIGRAREHALASAADQVRRGHHVASAGGNALSGNVVRSSVHIYETALEEAATTARVEMLDAIRTSLGDVDAQHAQYILERLNQLVDGLTRGINTSFEELIMPGRAKLPAGVAPALSSQLEEKARALRLDALIAIEPILLRAKLRALPKVVRAAAEAAGDEYDLFVSYASEDDSSLVRPLVEHLQQRQLKVWYAGQQLTLGDPLAERINQGLARSRYGVVVLSPAFLAKDWPMIELNALMAIAATVGRKKLLPVVHGLSQEELTQRIPLVSGLRWANSSVGIPALVEEIERGMN